MSKGQTFCRSSAFRFFGFMGRYACGRAG